MVRSRSAHQTVLLLENGRYYMLIFIRYNLQPLFATSALYARSIHCAILNKLTALKEDDFSNTRVYATLGWIHTDNKIICNTQNAGNETESGVTRLMAAVPALSKITKRTLRTHRGQPCSRSLVEGWLGAQRWPTSAVHRFSSSRYRREYLSNLYPHTDKMVCRRSTCSALSQSAVSQ